MNRAGMPNSSTARATKKKPGPRKAKPTKAEMKEAIGAMTRVIDAALRNPRKTKAGTHIELPWGGGLLLVTDPRHEAETVEAIKKRDKARAAKWRAAVKKAK